jgi:hypothetical protein
LASEEEFITSHVAKLDDGDAEAKTGKHCRYCPAKLKCSEYVDAAFTFDRSWDSLTPTGKSSLVRQAKQAIDVAETILEQAEKEVLEGKELPGVAALGG